ncbi:MAG: acyloxyacyl hydrolase [Prevotellaceae bacterium]|jgi:hypothetical protein|nr:acyloxyacyl hydrolase [Prevotellaceae bacterium]
MMQKYFFTIILLILFSFLGASAQENQSINKPDYFIEGGLRYGSMLHHPDNYDYTKDLWFNSCELRFGLQTHGKNAWERPLKKPILGVALRFTDYADFTDSKERRKIQRDVLGKNIALFGYVQVPIVRAGFFTWHFQLGMGAAVFTKIYSDTKQWEANENCENCHQENGLVSLRVNPYINFQSGFDFRLNNRFDLALNANFVHTSNASLNFPNWGINEIQGIASVRYHFNQSENPSKKAELLEKFKPHNALFFTIDPGWMWARYNNYYYLKTGVSAGYERQFFPILKAGAALEFHLSNALTPTREYKEVYYDGKSYKVPQVLFSSAVFVFGDITFGRFSFSVGAGAYLIRTQTLDGKTALSNFDLSQTGAYSGTLEKIPWFYEKVGLKISLGKKQNHFVGASIRAHFPVADYLAFTYGYRFWKF